MQGSGSGLCLLFELKTYSSLGEELKVNLHGPAKSAKKYLIYLNVSQSIKLKEIGTRDQTILSYLNFPFSILWNYLVLSLLRQMCF